MGRDDNDDVTVMLICSDCDAFRRDNDGVGKTTGGTIPKCHLRPREVAG